MISGALFFLGLTLHRPQASVDLTTIYHNIRYQHPLTGPQRNSGASEPFPAHFLTRIPEKRP
jgi:hypothetical protein